MRLAFCIFSLSLYCFTFGNVASAQTNEIDISIKASGTTNPITTEPAPLYTATTTAETHLTPTGAITTVNATFTLHQGAPKTFTLALHGPATLRAVTGSNLATWGLRQTPSTLTLRHLDLQPTPADLDKKTLTVTLQFHTPIDADTINLVLPAFGPADTLHLDQHHTIRADAPLAFTLRETPGFLRLDALAPGPRPEPDRLARLQGTPTASTALAPAIHLILHRQHEVYKQPRFQSIALIGAPHTNRTANAVALRLTGTLTVPPSADETVIDLLSGDAAPTAIPTFTNAHFRLHPAPNAKQAAVYRLHVPPAATAQIIPLDLAFDARVHGESNRRTLDFRVAAGPIIPLTLTGLPASIYFSDTQPVVPRKTNTAGTNGWRGFLPASGQCNLTWILPVAKKKEASLFFTSSATTDIRVAPGLLRQTTTLTFSILQGVLRTVTLDLQGTGEVLNVTGPRITRWTRNDNQLTIYPVTPITSTAIFQITAQTPLGDFPVRTTPLRLTPTNAVRHSGAIRLSNQGAVRLDLTDTTGLTQLAPSQFPGTPIPAPARQGQPHQVLVHQFPAAAHAYTVTADAILSETTVSQITRLHLGETDRVITSDMELDVREAPIRDFALTIPAGYSVAEVSGAPLADHTLDTTTRRLQLLFSQAIQGRHLLRLRLERTAPAQPGAWPLPTLTFPDAQTVRGHLGVSAAPGFRLSTANNATDAANTTGLAEIPIATFPVRDPDLQQAFRVRDTSPTAELAVTLNVEVLGQHVEVDAFHLTSLKQGIAFGSVLLNYYIAGSPVSQFRLHVPADHGNLVVDGQSLRTWNRVGETLTIDLDRPALGAHTLLLTFQQQLDARNPRLIPGRVHPLDVQGETGILQVTSPRQVRHTWTNASPNLLPLDPLELPAEFQLMSRAPSLGIHQYTERPFTLALDIEWLPTGETIEQLVDVAEFNSRVARNGEAVTEARYFVKTRGRKSLRLSLPEGLSLWEVRVANQIVKPRANDGHLIIPLPRRVDPNTAVDVFLRFGSDPAADAQPRLVAPRLSPATLFSRWHVHAEPGRQLLPGPGVASLNQPLPPTGFASLQHLVLPTQLANKPNNVTWTLLATLLLGLLLRLSRRRLATFLSALALIGATAAAIWIGIHTFAFHKDTSNRIEAVNSIITEGQTFSLPVTHTATFLAHLHIPGLIALGLGLLGLFAAIWLRSGRRLLLPLALLAIAIGLLLQHGGATILFLALAALLILRFVLPDLWRAFRFVVGMRHRPTPTANPLPPPAPPTPVPAPVVTPLLPFLFLLGGFALSPESSTAQPAAKPPAPADRMEQSARVQNNRLLATLTVQVTGDAGDTFDFLRPPAILTAFEAKELQVHQRAHGHQLLVLGKPGTFTATAAYELPIPDWSFNLPTGPATVNTLDLQTAGTGWTFRSADAVSHRATSTGTVSSARLVFGPKHPPRVSVNPPAQSRSTEATRLYAEVANLYVPGPGVIDARHRVNIRPSQGRVSALDLTIPDGFTVSKVLGPSTAKAKSTTVPLWRFDPTTRNLHIDIEPARSDAFSFVIETQRAAGRLPADLELLPLRVPAATGQIGTTALAFPTTTRAETVAAPGLAPLNPGDFPADLLPRAQPAPKLHRVFRYAKTSLDTPVKVTVGPVLPEVRAEWSQRLSLAADRTVLATVLTANILRAGLFRLTLQLPSDFEVETVSGPNLAQWNELPPITNTAPRLLHLDLNERAIGQQRFAITLVSSGLTARDAWPVPRLSLQNAARETGTLLVLPEQGIRARPVARSNVSILDARALGTAPENTGAQAFKLLQSDWSLALDIEQLDPWITAAALHEVTFHEGRVATRVNLRFNVENAAIKSLRLHLPGLSLGERDGLRATGEGLLDIVPVTTNASTNTNTTVATDTWDLTFRRRMIGTIPVTLETQRRVAATNDTARFSLIHIPAARQLEAYFALHTAGRLDLRPPETLPPGWQRSDWTAVPPALRRAARNATPAITLRVADPQGPLPLQVVRDDLADVPRLRVTSANLLTAFSHTGSAVTTADLRLQVIEKSTLRLQLPKGARLYNAFVNGESAAVVREANDTVLLHVVPNPFRGEPATVSITYADSTPTPKLRPIRSLDLAAPRLPIPMENLVWYVVVPDGLRLADHAGDLQPNGQRDVQASNLQTYLTQLRARDARRAATARDRLTTANELLREGQRDQALRMFDNIATSKDLDPASNEDARIQLQTLQTEQAWLGLSTRRQRVEIQNTPPADIDPRLAEAQRKNPLFQGQPNFRPDDINAFLSTSDAAEAIVLRRLAQRLTQHQLASVRAPQSIAIDLPRQGQLHAFSRHVHAAGAAPLSLQLTVAPRRTASPSFLIGTGGVIIVFALLFACARRRPASP